jgi:uncharacterized protein YceH (UPF0502 family)
MKKLENIEIRVLGCLVEKQLATPAYYPLTLNSLVAACNQKSNREPVLSLEEDEVERGLRGLRDKSLASRIKSAESRVDKYGHLVEDVFHMHPQEMAVMAELMLRGPQTPGELKQRASRMAGFASLSEVNDVLESLMDQGLVMRHERQPGRKERRYSQLLSEDAEALPEVQERAEAVPAQKGYEERISALEGEVRKLRQELDELKQG